MDARREMMDNPIIASRRVPGLLPTMNLTVHVTGYHENLRGVRIRRHKPRDYLLIYVTAGRFVGELGSRKIEAGAGDVVILPPGIPHRYDSDDDRPYGWQWAHFGGRAASRYAERIVPGGGGLVRLGRIGRIRERFSELIIHDSHPPLGVHDTRPAEQARLDDPLADALLHALLELIIYHLAIGPTDRTRVGGFDADAIRRYIHERLDQPIGVDELAATAHLSVPQFNRVFKRVFGQSPLRYIIQRRIDRACGLLSDTAMDMTRIAEAVGYDDPYYFSRLFSKTVGIAPSAYRGAAHRAMK